MKVSPKKRIAENESTNESTIPCSSSCQFDENCVSYSSTDDGSGQIPVVEQYTDKGTIIIMPIPKKCASCIEKARKIVSAEESGTLTDKICQVRE